MANLPTTQHEIERKFLLRTLPKLDWSDILLIDQFYKKNKSFWDRYRKLDSQINGVIKYQHTIKKTVSKGVNEEIEVELSEGDFIKNLSKCFLSKSEAKKITKIRYIFPYNGLKWEIDYFPDRDMIIAEIEIPTLDYALVIPDYISDNLIAEVTFEKEFSNRSLANKIPKPKTKIDNKIKKTNLDWPF